MALHVLDEGGLCEEVGLLAADFAVSSPALGDVVAEVEAAGCACGLPLF